MIGSKLLVKFLVHADGFAPVGLVVRSSFEHLQDLFSPKNEFSCLLKHHTNVGYFGL